ncbi:hypothetical protein ACIA59_10610 [Micromonospora haikouensis]|uniref:hypothetical protein n=1 Tax=Micromonospora haikouensis TaxID=686309 RepID=UPI0037A202C0
MTASGTVSSSYVASVNDESGVVDLDAGDVGADPAGTAAAVAADLLPRAANVAAGETVTVNRARVTGGAEGADITQTQYEGQRGFYTNGFGCARARVPNHADAAEQYAFRAACHSSKNGTNQPIGSFADSNNVDQFHTRANGDSYAVRDLHVGRNLVLDAPPAWLAATLNTGSGVAWAGAGYPTVASQLDAIYNRVYLRGRLTWSATLAAGTVLATLGEAHWPVETITLSVRTGPSSNLAAIATIDTSGRLSLPHVATGAAGYLGLDGLSFYRGASS